MPRIRFLSALVVLSLLALPLVALAQDGDSEEMQQYTSEDGLLTVSYPADWLARPSDFLYGVTLANSQDVFDTMDSDQGEGPVPSGMAIIEVTLASLDTLHMFGMDIEADMTPEETLQGFVDFITAPQDGPPGEEMGEPDMEATEEAEMEATEEAAMEATEEAEMTEEPMMAPPVAGEIMPLEFEDGRQAAWVSVEYGEESSDAYIMFQLDDGIYAVVNVYAASGELTDELIDTAVQIAQSVQFTGTVDDLAMPGPDVEMSDVDPSTLDGNALVNERCTVCHTRDRIDQADKDEEGWTATVDRMISYGAQLDSAEREAVIQYLVETH